MRKLRLHKLSEEEKQASEKKTEWSEYETRFSLDISENSFVSEAEAGTIFESIQSSESEFRRVVDILQGRTTGANAAVASEEAAQVGISETFQGQIHNLEDLSVYYARNRMHEWVCHRCHNVGTTFVTKLRNVNIEEEYNYYVFCRACGFSDRINERLIDNQIERVIEEYKEQYERSAWNLVFSGANEVIIDNNESFDRSMNCPKCRRPSRHIVHAEQHFDVNSYVFQFQCTNCNSIRAVELNEHDMIRHRRG